MIYTILPCREKLLFCYFVTPVTPTPARSIHQPVKPVYNRSNPYSCLLLLQSLQGKMEWPVEPIHNRSSV